MMRPSHPGRRSGLHSRRLAAAPGRRGDAIGWIIVAATLLVVAVIVPGGLIR